jgi:hypothetical protein
MSRLLVVLTGICVVAMLAGCATSEAKKAEATKVRPAAAAAKVEPAAEPKPTVQYVDTPTGRWMVHDENRPAPPIITPGGRRSSPPSDAVVLFDGTAESLKNWSDTKGEPTKWIVGEGYMESVKGAGYIQTKQEFGSCQLHVEFATPATVQGTGQGRGNSGVFLQGEYEVQVLDSYENKTYPDGQCGALYGRAVPLVNACRKPGEWQSYDIVYHSALFKDGKIIRKPKFVVVFQNGVLVQDDVTLEGGTGWINAHMVTSFHPIPDKGPIQLQDHGNPVRYRNIWVRELKD